MKFIGSLCIIAFIIIFMVHSSTTQEIEETTNNTIVEDPESSSADNNNATDTEIESSSPSSNDILMTTTTESPLDDETSTITSSSKPEETTTTKMRSPTSVNVLFTYEKEEMDKLIDVGLNYLKDKTSGYSMNSSRKLYMKDWEPTKIIVDLCKEIDEFEPDIVVDLTERGIPSEAIKIVTKTLQLPTVSSSHGRQKEWMNLNKFQSRYLLHVQSPADVAIQVTRTLSKTLNITNMAILHNNDYDMFYNYRDLLQDTSTRHSIFKLKRSEPEITDQLKAIQLARFTTVFIAGSVPEIEAVLKLALQLDIENRAKEEAAAKLKEEQAKERAKKRKEREEWEKEMKKTTKKPKVEGQEGETTNKPTVEGQEGQEEETTTEEPPTQEPPPIVEDEVEEEEDVEYKNFKMPLLHPTSSWYSLTLGKGPPPTCNKCPGDVSLVHFNPNVPSTNGIDWEGEGLEGSLEERFKVDLLVNTIHTAGKMKADNHWPENKTTIRCATYQYDTNTTELKNLDFATHFSNSMISQQSSYPIVVSETGDHFIELNLIMSHLIFKHEADTKSTKKVGTWKAGHNQTHSFDFEANQTLDFHKAQITYRVVTVVQPPFIYKRKNCEKFKHCYYGYSIDVLDELQRILKFNYTIYDVDMYGHMNDSGLNEWTGMMHKLKYREADMAIGAFSVMPEREKVMDFTDPVYGLVGFQVLMRKQPLQTALFKFLTVLENDVWMCILGAYFFTSILMWIFDRWSPYSFQNNKDKFEDDEEKREFTLRESLWFCITSLTPQGGGEAPKNLSGRLVAATWWLFGFIIIASYTANLAAFLTVSRLEPPVESLQDLSRQYKVMYAPIYHSSAYFYFDRMAHIEHQFYEAWKDLSLNDSLSEYERSGLAVWEYPVSDWYTKLWQSLVENYPPTNYSEALLRTMGKDSKIMRDRAKQDLTKVNEFAWIGESTEIRYEAMTHCMFRVVGKEFSMRPYAIGVQKGSPLKAQLNKEIRKLEHSRFFEQRKNRWWDQNENEAKCKKYDNLADGISIHNIGGVFIVVVLGFTMTFISTVLELWWYHRKNYTHDLSEFNSEAPSREWSAAFATVERTDFHAQYSRPPSKTSNW